MLRAVGKKTSALLRDGVDNGLQVGGAQDVVVHDGRSHAELRERRRRDARVADHDDAAVPVQRADSRRRHRNRAASRHQAAAELAAGRIARDDQHRPRRLEVRRRHR